MGSDIRIDARWTQQSQEQRDHLVQHRLGIAIYVAAGA